MTQSFPPYLTITSGFMFDCHHIFLIAAASAADLGELSDVELIARDPVLRLVGISFFLIGLACDTWLLARYFSKRHPPLTGLVTAKPWGAVELWSGIAAFFAGNAFLQVLILALPIPAASLWHAILAGNILINTLLLLLLGIYLRWRGVSWQTAFGGDTPPPFHPILAGVIGYFAIIPPLAIITQLVQLICRVLDIPATPQPIAELLATSGSVTIVGLIVALAVLVAPVFEEILFRGLAYPVLKKRWGLWRALVFVSLIFAVIHLHAPSAAALLVLGIALGLAYETTGSILTPITMHSLFNTANVFVLLHLRNAS